MYLTFATADRYVSFTVEYGCPQITLKHGDGAGNQTESPQAHFRRDIDSDFRSWLAALLCLDVFADL
jgi:hypothetical protein